MLGHLKPGKIMLGRLGNLSS